MTGVCSALPLPNIVLNGFEIEALIREMQSSWKKKIPQDPKAMTSA